MITMKLELRVVCAVGIVVLSAAVFAAGAAGLTPYAWSNKFFASDTVGSKSPLNIL